MEPDRGLDALMVAHFAAGPAAAVLASFRDSVAYPQNDLLVVPAFAFTLTQAVLLALWATQSLTSPWDRMIGLVIGAVYLEIMLTPGLWGELFGLPTMAVAVATAGLLMVRAMGGRLAQSGDGHESECPQPEGLRFTIRGLMAFTALVALLSAGARGLQSTPGPFWVLTAVLACFAAPGLVALWAALGHGRPSRRGPVVFALALALFAVAVAVDAHPAGWLYLALIMFLYPATLLGSLLIVRACGYRLVSRAPAEARPAV